MPRVRDKMVAFFVTESEKELMVKMAKRHGMNFSEYARYCIMEKAKKEQMREKQ